MKNIEEQKITELFNSFDPEMKSDGLFMARLENKLAEVELVKSKIEASRRRNKLAAIAAGVTGFLFGIVVAICYRYIEGMIADFVATWTIMPKYVTTITWGLTAIAGLTLILSAYEVALITNLRR